MNASDDPQKDWWKQDTWRGAGWAMRKPKRMHECLSVDILPVSDAKNQGNQPDVLDRADEAVIADAILPKLTESWPLQGLTDSSRIVQLSQTIGKEFEDALGCLRPACLTRVRRIQTARRCKP